MYLIAASSVSFHIISLYFQKVTLSGKSIRNQKLMACSLLQNFSTKPEHLHNRGPTKQSQARRVMYFPVKILENASGNAINNHHEQRALHLFLPDLR